MTDSPSNRRVSRRKALTGIGASGFLLSQTTPRLSAETGSNETTGPQAGNDVLRFPDKWLRHSHVNTMIGNEIIGQLKSQGITLTPEFIAQLACRYDTSRLT